LGARALAKEPPADPSSRAEDLQKILGALDKENGDEPSVLGGVDLDRAPAMVRRTAQILKRTKVTLSLEKQDLESALSLFHKMSGVTFVMSAKAREAAVKEKREVSFQFKDLPLENVLNLMALELRDYRFTLRHGAVLLLRREEYKPERILRIYDVRDLIHQPTDFPAPWLGLGTKEEGFKQN
jgi:hypothetical protein